MLSLHLVLVAYVKVMEFDMFKVQLISLDLLRAVSHICNSTLQRKMLLF